MDELLLYRSARVTSLRSSDSSPRAEGARAIIPHSAAALYGLASIGTATFIATPQLLLLFFMTETLGAPAQIAGLAILAPKVIEMVMDPLMGAISDRTRTAWGPRLPYMLVGAIVTPLGFLAVFAPPAHLNGSVAALYVATAFLIATVAYTLYAVPFVTLAGEITDGPDGRRRVVAWRMSFVAIGILAAGAGAPALVAAFGGARPAYAQMSKFAALLIGIVFVASVAGVWQRARIVRTANPQPLLPALKAVTRASGYARLWIAYGIQAAAGSLNFALVPYAVKYLIHGDSSLVAQALTVLIACSLIAIPAWVKLAARWGDVATYRISVVTYAAGFALFFWCDGSTGLGLWLAAICTGAAQGGIQLLSFALLPHAIEATPARLAGTGAMTGVWVAGEKLALALGAAIAGAGLGAAGYVSAGAELTAQPTSALVALRWLLSLIPAAVCLTSLWALAGLERKLGAAPRAHALAAGTVPKTRDA